MIAPHLRLGHPRRLATHRTNMLNWNDSPVAYALHWSRAACCLNSDENRRKDDPVSIQIQGVGRDKLLRTRAARLVEKALAHLRVGPVSASVRFSDENGPKGGPAMRCAINVRAPYEPELRVERSANKART